MALTDCTCSGHEFIFLLTVVVSKERKKAMYYHMLLLEDKACKIAKQCPNFFWKKDRSLPDLLYRDPCSVRALYILLYQTTDLLNITYRYNSNHNFDVMNNYYVFNRFYFIS
jgi:hypothetical protein